MATVSTPYHRGDFPGILGSGQKLPASLLDAMYMRAMMGLLGGGGGIMPGDGPRRSRGKGHFHGRHKPAQRKRYKDKSRERYVKRMRAKEVRRAG